MYNPLVVQSAIPITYFWASVTRQWLRDYREFLVKRYHPHLRLVA